MDAAWWFSLLCEALCAAFAIRAGIWRRFALYITADLVLNLVLVALRAQGSAPYYKAYGVYRVAVSALLILAAHEAVSIEAQRRRAGDTSLSAIVRWLGTGTGVAIAAVLLWLVAPSLAWSSTHRGDIAIWRTASALTAGWLAAVWFTAHWLPEQWAPARRHRLWLFAYAAMPTLIAAAMDFGGPAWIRTANYVHLGWASVCYLIWPVIVARAS